MRSHFGRSNRFGSNASFAKLSALSPAAGFVPSTKSPAPAPVPRANRVLRLFKVIFFGEMGCHRLPCLIWSPRAQYTRGPRFWTRPEATRQNEGKEQWLGVRKTRPSATSIYWSPILFIASSPEEGGKVLWLGLELVLNLNLQLSGKPRC